MKHTHFNTEHFLTDPTENMKTVLSLIMIIFHITTAVCLYKQEAFPQPPRTSIQSGKKDNSPCALSACVTSAASSASLCSLNVGSKSASSWPTSWPFLSRCGKDKGLTLGGSEHVGCSRPVGKWPKAAPTGKHRDCSSLVTEEIRIRLFLGGLWRKWQSRLSQNTVLALWHLTIAWNSFTHFKIPCIIFCGQEPLHLSKPNSICAVQNGSQGPDAAI